MSEIKLFADMQLKTEPVASYHLKKNDLIVLDNLIYRVTESAGSFTSPRYELEPVWSFETNREASGITRDFDPDGPVEKVLLAY